MPENPCDDAERAFRISGIGAAVAGAGGRMYAAADDDHAIARPELLEKRPTWGAGHRNFSSIYLEPLSGNAMEELLAGLVPGLPSGLREQIELIGIRSLPPAHRRMPHVVDGHLRQQFLRPGQHAFGHAGQPRHVDPV